MLASDPPRSLQRSIPVASCSPRQAPSGPKRKLENDFICQLPSSIMERFAFLGTTDPCCAPQASGGPGVYVSPGQHAISTTRPICPRGREDTTTVFCSQQYLGKGSWQPLGRHPPPPHCHSQQIHKENHSIPDRSGSLLLSGQGTWRCSRPLCCWGGSRQNPTKGLVLGTQREEALMLYKTL